MRQIFVLSLFLTVFISSCGNFNNKPKQIPIAKVFNKNLYQSDLAEIIPQNISPQDSISMANKFINNWIRKELMLRKAELNLSEREKNFEKQIADYRTSLIIFKYQQQLLNQKLDTVVSKIEIQNYYDQNSPNFILNQIAIRAFFIKVPLNAPNINQIKLWSRNERDIHHLESYAKQYAVIYDYFNDDWIYFDHLLKEIPITITDQERFLRNNPYVEVVDSLYYYFAGIKEFKLIGSRIPLSLVEENIKNTIIKKRKLDFLQNLEINLYNEALSKNLFEIY